MHPVLLSLANIIAGVRMKATARTFGLAGYVPTPTWLNVTKEVASVLTARLYHVCIDIITKNLKAAEKHGARMSDPAGNIRICHTPLVSWICDLPEQRMQACVLNNQSPVTLATLEQFGDPDPKLHRTRYHTMDLIRQALKETDPAFIPQYIKTCQPLGLNGVHQPFWRDWGRACPSQFLTPDALHQLHKFFFDHTLKWVINIIGGDELDRRISALQPRVGVRHWANGISKLKQCTGREHRELERILIVAAAGAVDRDIPQTLPALRAIVDFIFQAQGLLLYEEHLHSLSEALREFHINKNAIIMAGGRRGKKGLIGHFNIPKLEAMQWLVRSARLMGAPYQYTSDITERCHCTHCKRPFRSSSKKNFHEQCCRYMDRDEKIKHFGLFTSLLSNGSSLTNEMILEAQEMRSHYPEAVWLSHALPKGDRAAASKLVKSSLFDKVHARVSKFNIAFHLNKAPHHPHLLVAAASDRFNLPDLHPALGDCFSDSRATYSERGGRRKSTTSTRLPFSHIHVWNSFRIQQFSAQDDRVLLPPRTVQALPPSSDMPFGRCNTVLVDVEDSSGYRTSAADDRREFFPQLHFFEI